MQRLQLDGNLCSPARRSDSQASWAMGGDAVFRAHLPLKKLAHTLSETLRYLEMNADSMPDYGKRSRAG
jgi:hypothetical protein